jgi:hypothetical protein
MQKKSVFFDNRKYIHNSWTRFRFLEQKEECIRSDCCTKDVDGENLLEDGAEQCWTVNDPNRKVKSLTFFDCQIGFDRV